MKILPFILRVLVGLAFIISGILKLYPVEYFENDLLIHRLSTDSVVVYQARLLITAEIFLGASLILVLWDRPVIRLSCLMLILYSAWLLFIIFTKGNSGNCGCFGQYIELTPLEGIIKNMVLILFLAFIYRYPATFFFRYKNIAGVLLLVFSVALPFIIAPPIYSSVRTGDPGKPYYPNYSVLTSDSLLTTQLKEGKKIVAFFLSGCEHCKLAATRLESVYRAHPDLPVHAFISGKTEKVADFVTATQISYSFTSCDDLPVMIRVAGNDYPSIQFVNNGLMEQEMSLYNLKERAVLDWFSVN